jgi:peroxiredoxin
MRKITVSVALAFVMVLLGMEAVAQSGMAIIKGTLQGTKPQDVSVFSYSDGTKTLGAGEVDSLGVFWLEATLPEPDIYKLQFKDGMYLALVLIPGDSITITADMRDMIHTLEIGGSEASALIYSTEKQLGVFQAKMDSLTQLYNLGVQAGIGDSLLDIYKNQFGEIETSKEAFLVSFLKQHSDKLTVLFFVEKLSMDEYFDSYRVVDEGLYKKYPKNKFVVNFHNRVESSVKLAVGSPAPEIALPDPEGNIVKLSSLKGKVVLIDFWASWCGPCRRENPNMVKIYKEYNSKGFEIFSVSLDKAKDAWVKAIKDDGLTWTHVSDLKFWQCEAAITYNVSAVPYTVLLDREGKIAAKGLRGEELFNRIKALLN